MTDELLQNVMETMDLRGSTQNQNHDSDKTKRRLFHFLRFRPELHVRDYDLVKLKQYNNEECEQSQCQNMHPAIVYAERDKIPRWEDYSWPNEAIF